MANTLTLTDEQTEFTPQQRQALESLGIGAVTPGDLQIFLHECQKTGLDPFQKQIYLIRRGDKSTIQVGIDGLQTIARRTVTKTGEAFGEAPILWCGTDGVWRDIWLPLQPPAAAKAVVKRGEGTFTAVALFREFAPMYNGKLSGLWAKMPAHMIGKVAMAHALRQAFPAEMSGVYTDDEMEQAGPSAPVQVQTQPVQARPVQPTQPQQPKQAAPVQPVQAAPRRQAPAQPAPTTGGDPWAAPIATTPAKQPTPEEKAKDDAWRAGLKPATAETPRGGWANALREHEAQTAKQDAKEQTK